ncbi:MAG TPA: UDP-glucose--hexose-1-phosphate uridylyltransferase [Methylomirabilota bacterium]|jgi:UDPglucose--hexose-1-phosphate uridylyltransferase|nr:UDP-glucose--hexose-1-phosphate uridylyltransferase [Methylomirabilota bacterium]
MNPSPFDETPHRRFNPLTREWVLVSPHREQRPWLGKVEKAAPAPPVTFDPSCYLCPGNARAGGVRNPDYKSTFVFDNDFPALLPDAPARAIDEEGLIVARSESGICRVVCFTPRHDQTIPRMGVEETRRVIDVWAEQYCELGARPAIRHVQIFENCGALMGASNPHPHCQIWADAELPNIPARETQSFREYRRRHGACLLCRYLEMELARNARVVCANDGFVALVPYWAVWPFESMILSRRHVQDLTQLGDRERTQLAELMRRLTIRYDNLFETAFPYSMGFHQRPTDGETHADHHLHAHYFPPLLRSATVQKFMVGYELLGTPQRDLTPETAAARLREMSETHFLDR